MTKNQTRRTIAPSSTLRRNVVCEISFLTRDLSGHDDREDGIIEAFWTGEIDTWGKLTIRPVDGDATLYLFADEIIAVETL